MEKNEGTVDLTKELIVYQDDGKMYLLAMGAPFLTDGSYRLPNEQYLQTLLDTVKANYDGQEIAYTGKDAPVDLTGRIPRQLPGKASLAGGLEEMVEVPEELKAVLARIKDAEGPIRYSRAPDNVGDQAYGKDDALIERLEKAYGNHEGVGYAVRGVEKPMGR